MGPAGTWRVGDYSVEVPAIEDAWLLEASNSFGLKLGIGPRPAEVFGELPAELDIHTNCEGLCEPAGYETTVKTKLAASVADNLAQDAHGVVEWVQRPVKTGERWWMRARALAGGKVVRETAVVTVQAPDIIGGWLECRVEVGEHDLARLDALLAICQKLAWKRAGEAQPFEPPFGHHYVLGDVTFDVAPPPQFALDGYSRHGISDEVRFRGPSIFDEVRLSTDCNGDCDPQQLRTNLDHAFAEDSKPASGDDRPFEAEPVVDIAPNRWIQRRHYPAHEGLSESRRITVRGLRPGAHSFLVCSAAVEGDEIGRIDEMQRLCLAAMRPW